HGDNKKQ
ncbi:hypothetical protein ECEC1865_2797, partial [Escherichia coli EC1865]